MTAHNLIMEAALAWIAHYRYLGLFSALMFGIAGLPIPDETILVICGYMIATGRMTPLQTFLTACCGSICGISLSYAIGRTAGHAVINRYGRYLHVKPVHVQRVHDWFNRIGNWILTVGYFILGVRHLTALVAGITKLEFPVFARFAYSGAVIWVTTFLTIGYFVGDHWQSAIAAVHRYTGVVTGIVVVALFAAILFAPKRRGRKLDRR